ncbi:Sphingoid long chain base kinase 4 [Neolecta irregularis DAH-3]|uniref:Sphingoid long chain base kinase 4 n=1 Tax=Neolecta irregularis (strain DAH-3) TaxID=1198029 RepID=A0A1U7LPV2_NEOID|nr:Sphingoid long chain base kinase 4 [Neolecta irregularis DAH-3]|eukprot:OLL24613.1 Sphingoid long chain base kinase 4 [Neolecta irregularis DAH-3]
MRQSKKRAIVQTYEYELECDSSEFVALAMEKAYHETICHKRFVVLINPVSGSGKAQTNYEQHARPFFESAGCFMQVCITTNHGHAMEIAKNLDLTAIDAIVCVSGDGLPHDVFNGLGQRKDACAALQTPIAMIPGGSGNALALNLYGTSSPSVAALEIVKGIRVPIDLCSVTQGQSRYLSFLSQSWGVIADSDLETEHLR